MLRQYKLRHGLIAYLLFFSFLLQSCDFSYNSSVPNGLARTTPTDQLQLIPRYSDESIFERFAECLKDLLPEDEENFAQNKMAKAIEGNKFHSIRNVHLSEFLEPSLFNLDEKAKKNKKNGNVDLFFNSSVFEIKLIRSINADIDNLNGLIEDIIRCALCDSPNTLNGAYFVGIAHNQSLTPLGRRGGKTNIEAKLNLPITREQSIEKNWLSTFEIPTDPINGTKNQVRETIQKARNLFVGIGAQCVYRKLLNDQLTLMIWKIKGNLKPSFQVAPILMAQTRNQLPTNTPFINQMRILPSQADNNRLYQARGLSIASNQLRTFYESNYSETTISSNNNSAPQFKLDEAPLATFQTANIPPAIPTIHRQDVPFIPQTQLGYEREISEGTQQHTVSPDKQENIANKKKKNTRFYYQSAYCRCKKASRERMERYKA